MHNENVIVITMKPLNTMTFVVHSQVNSDGITQSVIHRAIRTRLKTITNTFDVNVQLNRL